MFLKKSVKVRRLPPGNPTQPIEHDIVNGRNFLQGRNQKYVSISNTVYGKDMFCYLNFVFSHLISSSDEASDDSDDDSLA